MRRGDVSDNVTEGIENMQATMVPNFVRDVDAMKRHLVEQKRGVR
jgi:hypothetical protein